MIADKTTEAEEKERPGAESPTVGHSKLSLIFF